MQNPRPGSRNQGIPFMRAESPASGEASAHSAQYDSYQRSDDHVHVLAASIRTINHLLCSFFRVELQPSPSARHTVVGLATIRIWRAKSVRLDGYSQAL